MDTIPELIGKHHSIIKIKETISKITRHNTYVNILIRGETGTGKEVIAKLLHYHYFKEDWDKVPFIEINCSSLSATFFESELFGHTKGAFTSAITSKTGLVKKAENGTLFFDEVGDIDLSVQLKFLRFLETRKYRPLGSTREYSTFARFIFASNANFENLLKYKQFRNDLYFRINEIPIYIPPLRERISDIPILTNYLFDKLLKEYGLIGQKKLSKQVYKYFQFYNWPGNVRELLNVLKRLILLSDKKTITKKDIPEYIYNPQTITTESPIDVSIPYKEALKNLEKYYIIEYAKQCHSIQDLSTKLGISPPTLYSRIREHNIYPIVRRNLLKS